MVEKFELRERLDSLILSIAGVERRRSRWGKSDAYFVDGTEFVHFHGQTEIDIRLTRPFQRLGKSKLREDSRVKFRAGNSDWIVLAVSNSQDVEFALQLIRLACEANRKRNGLLAPGGAAK